MAFALIGIIFIHLLNIVRIGLLNCIYFYYSEYQEISHDYLFPSLIYGSTLTLIIVWIIFFKSEKIISMCIENY
ncbi:hypothetical protein [Bacteroidetes bacterium endosymbiont of Geopemphigus sp.]|uniref:hypothetical protein n=1 Tax=Bacteroidetes bacterium endosymbiont of Geopemphigus sp. TaxID=2047937 RepID=UPI0011AF2A45